jgi:hypothetical protein
VTAILKANPTWLDLELRSFNDVGGGELTYDLTTSKLQVPKGIDLTATSW